MKKTILLSMIAASLMADISIGEFKMKNPVMSAENLSVEHGGTKSMIDAYSDGVGVIIVGDYGIADNTAVNNLVYKYGEGAKKASASLPDYVLGLSSASAKDKALAQKIKDNLANSQYFPDRTACDDNNINTINDIYTNGVCQGLLKFGFNVIWDNNVKYKSGIIILNPSDGSAPYTFGVRIVGAPVVQALGVSVQELKDLGYSEISFNVESGAFGVVGYCYNNKIIAYEYGRNIGKVPFNINLTTNIAHIGAGYGTPEYNIDLNNYDSSLFRICVGSIQAKNGRQLWSDFVAK